MAAGAALAAALLFVALVTYLPHMNTPATAPPPGEEGAGAWSRLGAAYLGWANGTSDDYPYPMHVDSNVHWVNMATILRHDTMRHPGAYNGDPYEAPPFSLSNMVHEKGFTLALATFQEMSGLPFLHLIRFAPAAFAVLTASLVWAALRPWPAAPLAAAFVALVPTSARFLGIGFFVPIGIGLAWLAAALMLAGREDARHRGLALAIVATWAFFIHLIVGFATLLVVLASLPFTFRVSRFRALAIAVAAAAPFFLLLPAFSADFSREAERIGDLPVDFTIFDQLGIPFLILWAAGVSLVALRPPAGPIRIPILTASLASVVPLALIVTNLSLTLRSYALYDRWHQVFALLAVVPAAFALWAVADHLRAGLVRMVQAGWGEPRARRFAAGMTVLLAVAVPLAGAAAATPGLTAHLDEPYYFVLDDDDWNQFTAFARSDPGPQYEVFLAHPWKAPILTALTGKYPATYLTPGVSPGPMYDDYVVQGKYQVGGWLIERDVSVVFAPVAPTDSGYVVHPSGAYVLRPELAAELASLRGP